MSFQLSTVAGSSCGFADGPASEARFYFPRGVAAAPDGSIYVADLWNNRIRRIANGYVTTFAGDGVAGFLDGPAATARFNRPHGLCVGPDGVVFVADLQNHCIRKIKDGIVITIAGNGSAGFLDGPALSAKMSSPHSVAVGGDGSVYVADINNHRIRLIKDGRMSTVAGDGVAGYLDGPSQNARFHTPHGVAVDSDGCIYVADLWNHRIRSISNGKVTTLAGTGAEGAMDGAADKAQFNRPIGIAVSSASKAVYVVDEWSSKIREIADGRVSTLAGSSPGYSDSTDRGGQFQYPTAVALGLMGDMLIADNCNHRIRLLTIPASRKSWHYDPSIKLSAFPSSQSYAIIPAGKTDFDRAVALYQKQGPVPGHKVAKVEVIFNSNMDRQFYGRLKLLEARRDKPVFAPKWRNAAPSPSLDHRHAVMRLFDSYASPNSDSEFPNVKIVSMWHGTQRHVVESIAETGFAVLALGDAGYFGKGIYTAYEPSYSFSVYGKTLLLCWVAVFSPFPVIDGDMDILFGSSNHSNHDAHFIPVVPVSSSPAEKNFIPCKRNQAHKYSELVVFEAASILPRYIVTLEEEGGRHGPRG